ncbi:recombinase family protein [Neobacillus sedimentimangrovi]|uniref:Recombinase family protein n=1 Tax=Neobacillus sedimentimangrovi TaxID=2699460 RepID=A0ABS8QFY5_9BACI|nr:recombinase family protein [Neobacillus sedimentimangrovi]MCD4838132.1 recombinase family protein [Neobacillus sedimentimangrovi]
MKVAAYIRVSTEEQAQEGYSIPAQRSRLEAYALSQGWEIVQWYVDEGESAKDLNRTELKRMLKALEQNIFDCVLVYRLDRLTRSVLDLYQLLNKFEKHNVKFKSATEVYDTTTAIGRLFITLVAALAQWERENLAERVRMGMQQKAKEGKWTVSTPPFGYDAHDSILKINSTEAAVVKEIYKLYLSGKGMLNIARDLNQRGLWTKRGKPWSSGTIEYILTNPIYAGTLRYNYRVNKDQYFEVDGVAPAIVSEEDFNLAQKIISSRRQVHPRQATSKFIFSKVLKCGRCGKTLIGKTCQSKRGDKVYSSYNYFCPNRRRALCDMPLINQNFMEQKFLEMMDSWQMEQEAAELLQDQVAATVEDRTETIRQLEQELKEIEKRRSKWQYAWVNNMFSSDDAKNDSEFKKRMTEENENEKLIRQELESLSYHETPSQDSNILEYLTDIKLNWEYMDNKAKKQFILIAINSMTVDKISKEKSPDSIEIKEVRFN